MNKDYIQEINPTASNDGTVESMDMRGGPLLYTGKHLALPWVYAARNVFFYRSWVG
jgi:hypothetical protein